MQNGSLWIWPILHITAIGKYNFQRMVLKVSCSYVWKYHTLNPTLNLTDNCRALECDLISQWCDKKNLRSHWCDQPIEKKKSLSATLKVSLWFNNRHTLGPYRGLNQSEIVKGGPPPWLAMVQIFLYVCVSLKMRVLLQSDRERGE